jgi:hypothetical protein
VAERMLAPPPPPLGGGGRTLTTPAGGGKWVGRTPERETQLATDIKLAQKGTWVGAAAEERLGLTEAKAPNGGATTRAQPQEALDRAKGGGIAAVVLGGAGVVGTGIAFARGGAWWLSLLLLPAAGAAYYLTRVKEVPVAT